jgi:hypothetical protein
MKWTTVGIVLMLLCVLVAPAMAGSEERYSYITVKGVTVQLVKERAVITVDYTIDQPIGFLVLLLGKSDLKRKVLQMLDFDDGVVQRVDLERAVVFVNNASLDYGHGSYWFPEHKFNVVVPSLTIITPQEIKSYEQVNRVPDGLGYFATY